jgi:hypothetical protein
MKRSYLEEDIQLVQAYFPGSRIVPLRTPFDLTDHPSQRAHATLDTFRDASDTPYNLSGSALWLH